MIKYFCNVTGRLCDTDKCRQWHRAHKFCKLGDNLARLFDKSAGLDKLIRHAEFIRSLIPEHRSDI